MMKRKVKKKNCNYINKLKKHLFHGLFLLVAGVDPLQNVWSKSDCRRRHEYRGAADIERVECGEEVP